jgi:hypothetical protein
MQHRTIVGRLSAALLMVVISVVSAFAQTSGGSAPTPQDQKQESTTPLVPSGKVKTQGVLGKADRRRELARQVNQLIVSQNVKNSALGKLRENYDGTALAALKFHCLAIQLVTDTADLLPALSATIDDLRAEVRGDLEQKKDLRDLRANQVQESQSSIDQIGQQILTGKDTDENELSADQLDDLRAVIHQRIMQREERRLDVERFESQVKAYQQELVDLRKLDRRLDAMAVVSQAYLERLLDSVENEREGIISQEVVEGRKQLQEVVAALETRARAHEEPILTTRHDKGERSGVSTGDLATRLKQELKPDERKLVDDELEKLKQRMNNPQAN